MKYSDFPGSLLPCYWLSSVPPFKSCKHPYRGGRWIRGRERQKGKSLPSPSLGTVMLQIQFLKPAPSPLLWLLNSFLLLFLSVRVGPYFPLLSPFLILTLSFLFFTLLLFFSCLLSLFPSFDFPFPPFFALCSAALPAYPVLEKTQVIPFSFDTTFNTANSSYHPTFSHPFIKFLLNFLLHLLHFFNPQYLF